MKKLLFLLGFCMIFAHAANSQDYNNGVGVRLGVYSGVTFKHFINQTNALEAQLTSHPYWGGVLAFGMFEMHFKPFSDDAFQWFFGFGTHIGDYNSRYYHGGFLLGVNSIGGLEYTFDQVPINLGADIKPMINIISNDKILFFDTGIYARYTF